MTLPETSNDISGEVKLHLRSGEVTLAGVGEEIYRSLER